MIIRMTQDEIERYKKEHPENVSYSGTCNNKERTDNSKSHE